VKNRRNISIHFVRFLGEGWESHTSVRRKAACGARNRSVDNDNAMIPAVDGFGQFFARGQESSANLFYIYPMKHYGK